MFIKPIPPTVQTFLNAHGAGYLTAEGASDLPALVSVFRDSAPSEESDPLSLESLTWLSSILDCISAMDERIYEHYRAMIDLFRAGVFRAPREKLLAYPSWNSLREKGVRLGLLPEELYGKSLPQPHLGLPEEYLRRKEGGLK